jgi:hypothetical protein
MFIGMALKAARPSSVDECSRRYVNDGCDMERSEPAFLVVMRTRASGSRTGSDRRSTASHTLNAAAVAPIPIASEEQPMSVKLRCLASVLREYLKSSASHSSLGRQFMHLLRGRSPPWPLRRRGRMPGWLRQVTEP